MKIKKYLFLLPLMALVLVGCGATEETPDPDPVEPTTPTTPTDPDPDPTDPDPEPEEINFDYESLLATLSSTDFAQAGELDIYYGEDQSDLAETTIGVKSLWDGEFYFIEHTYYNDDGSTAETVNSRVYKDSDGYAVSRSLNYDNTLIDSYYYDGDGNRVVFDDEYDNPFKSLTVDNFEATSVDEEGTTIVVVTVPEATREYFSYFFTAYQDVPIETFTLTVTEDGAISGSAAFDESYEEDGVWVYSGGTYQFDIVSQDTIDTGRVTTLEVTEELQPLAEMLAKLSEHNFEMNLTKTGLGATQYVTFETANISLRSYDYNRSTISGRTYEGYYEDENGLHPVTSSGYTLNGTAAPETGRTLASLRSSFGLSAALFDVEDEDTFVLKEGYESYAVYGSVDYRYNSTNLSNVQPGTYKIKITGTNSVEITYDYANNWNESGVEIDTTTISVTGIGTTTSYFTFNPYLEPTGDGWDSYSTDYTDILKKYLDDNYNDLLPYIDLSAYSNGQINEFTQPTRGVILFSAGTATTAETFVSDYRASLVTVGWSLVEEKEEYSYIIANDDGGYYHLRVYSLTSYVYILLHQKGTGLDDYLNSKFETSINSTVTINQSTTYYLYDSESQSRGDFYSGPSETTTTFKFLDDQVMREGSTTYYYAVDEDGVFYVFYYASYLGEWQYQTKYDAGTYTIETYNLYNTIPPTTLMDYTDYCLYQSSTDEVYNVDSSVVSLLAQYIFNVSSSYISSAVNLTATLEIDYFSDELVVNCKLDRVQGTYYWIEYEYTATYSNFGSTRITGYDLPDLSQY